MENEILIEAISKYTDAVYALAGAVAELSHAVSDMIVESAEEDSEPATYLDGSRIHP